MEKITSVTILEDIQLLLMDDIQELKHMLNEAIPDSQSYQFIQSMIDVKYIMLRLIPETSLVKSMIPTPPYKHAPATYKKVMSFHADSNESKLLRVVARLENDQMEFIKQQLFNQGINHHSRKILNNLLGIYIKETEQLERALRTRQLRPIIL